MALVKRKDAGSALNSTNAHHAAQSTSRRYTEPLLRRPHHRDLTLPCCAVATSVRVGCTALAITSSVWSEWNVCFPSRTLKRTFVAPAKKSTSEVGVNLTH